MNACDVFTRTDEADHEDSGNFGILQDFWQPAPLYSGSQFYISSLCSSIAACHPCLHIPLGANSWVSSFLSDRATVHMQMKGLLVLSVSHDL